jgi:hypothetical protein
LNHPKDFCTEVRGKTKQTCTCRTLELAV